MAADRPVLDVVADGWQCTRYVQGRQASAAECVPTNSIKATSRHVHLLTSRMYESKMYRRRTNTPCCTYSYRFLTGRGLFSGIRYMRNVPYVLGILILHKANAHLTK